MFDKLFPNSSKEFEKFLEVFVDELSKNIETVTEEVTKEVKNTKEKLEEEIKTFFDDENNKEECKKLFPTNVYTNEKEEIVEIALPGMKKEDIIIDLEEPDNKDYYLLTVIAERKYEYKDYKEIIKNIPDDYTIELTFSKNKYDILNSIAEYNDGILKIVIPFKKTDNKIKIN